MPIPINKGVDMIQSGPNIQLCFHFSFSPLCPNNHIRQEQSLIIGENIFINQKMILTSPALVWITPWILLTLEQQSSHLGSSWEQWRNQMRFLINFSEDILFGGFFLFLNFIIFLVASWVCAHNLYFLVKQCQAACRCPGLRRLKAYKYESLPWVSEKQQFWLWLVISRFPHSFFGVVFGIIWEWTSTFHCNLWK